MSLKVTDDCTCCDACVPVCPNDAISAGDVIYEIDIDRCTECVGVEDEPQCLLVCPIECIEVGVTEDQDTLIKRHESLN